MKHFLSKLLFIFLILIISGCKNEELIEVEIPLEYDPAIMILGKWQKIKSGEYYIDKPRNVIEFSIDSVYCIYDAENKSFNYSKYWIDSILHIEYDLLSGNTSELRYSYTFSENYDQLTLIILNYTDHIHYPTYKRTKE